MGRWYAGLPWLAPRATDMGPSLARGGLPSHIVLTIIENPPDCWIEREHPDHAKRRIQLQRCPETLTIGNGPREGVTIGTLGWWCGEPGLWDTPLRCVSLQPPATPSIAD
jgi:hypothetical protein